MARVLGIIQARMGSRRLPRKMMMKLGEEYIISWVIKRMKRCKKIDQLIVATSTESQDDILYEFCKSCKLNIFRGSEKDVLLRYSKASLHINEEVIVRITGDCPLIDPKLLSEGIKLFKEKNYDYLSNCFPPSFPDGLDFEIFTKTILFEANKICKNPEEREHVTPWKIGRAHV